MAGVGAVAIGGHELIVGAQAQDFALGLGGAAGGRRCGRGGCVRCGIAATACEQAAHIGKGADQGRVIAEAGLVEDLFQGIAAEPVDGALGVLDPGVEATAPFVAQHGFAFLAFLPLEML